MDASPPTANTDTQDVLLHVKPGRKRAPFFRYIRINLPRLTRAVVLGILFLLAGCSASVAADGFSVFGPVEFGGIPLLSWLSGFVALLAFACGFLGLVRPRVRIWHASLLPAGVALALYGAAFFGTPVYVWNGASIPQAAAWNTTMLSSVALFVLHWALSYGVLAAYPDDQGFED